MPPFRLMISRHKHRFSSVFSCLLLLGHLDKNKKTGRETEHPGGRMPCQVLFSLFFPLLSFSSISFLFSSFSNRHGFPFLPSFSSSPCHRDIREWLLPSASSSLLPPLPNFLLFPSSASLLLPHAHALQCLNVHVIVVYV